MSNPRSSAASVREQKLARVIDREVAPIWHDRFARMLLRELPSNTGTFVLDIHSGPGHTTAELLQRLDESSRVVALGRDPWLMQVSKTRVRPEWKRRVYFKAGDMDDVPAMADDTYDLAIANLVLGEQVVDWQAALAELVRVTKPGGQVLATLPMHGTWAEVEDLFEELLRDEDMRREVVTLQKLRRRRPKPSQLVSGLRELGIGDDDVVVEHERFELLFRSGREFLFAPVIEHGPLRLWKAIIGRAEKPQALFWRFKEAIDTYYAGHVLAVTVVAGLIRLRVPGAGVTGSYAAEYWTRYPSLARLWGAPGADASKPAEDEFFDLDLDLEIDTDADDDDEDEDDAAAAADSTAAATLPTPGDSGSGFADHEGSGLSELPAVDGAALGEEDPLGGLLEQLEAEDAAAAEVAAEDAAASVRAAPGKTGRAATLGAVSRASRPSAPADERPSGLRDAGDSSSGLRSLPRKPGESGASPLPNKLPRKPGESGVSPLPNKLPRKPGESGASPLPGKLPSVPAVDPPRPGSLKPPPGVTPPPGSKPGATGRVLLPGMPRKDGKPVAPPPPRTGSVPIVGSKPVKPPSAVPTQPAPTVGGTGKPEVGKPGEDDPFASMLSDDEDDIDEIEELDELSPVDGDDDDDDDDLASSFGDVSPDSSSSGMRRVPPPPPVLPPKKK